MLDIMKCKTCGKGILKIIITYVLAFVLLLALVGCSSSVNLPKGAASRIDFTDGWEIGASQFEYINETTVKIIRESDGQVWYVPASSIDMIWVEN